MGRLRGDAEIDGMIDAIGKAKPAAPVIGRPVLGAIVALFAAGAGVGVWRTPNRTPTHATDVDEQRTVQVADGSSVRLDTDSRIRVRLSGRERNIELLEGQALFEVAHDAARPFVVSADGTTVTALIRVFDVQRPGSDVPVVLVEGKVRVDAPRADQKTLTPNSPRS